MKITRAQNSDAKILTRLTLQSKSSWKYTKGQLQEWKDELTITPVYIEKNEVFCLKENGIFVGFYAYNAISKGTVKLNFFFIDPLYIGKGYGKKLLSHFMQRIEKKGFIKVSLDADPNAEAFYKRFGFKTVGQLKSSIKNRYLPIMTKEIKKSNA